MKAAVLYGPKDLRVVEFKEPELNDNAIKIKVEYCGICGSDIHKYLGLASIRPVSYPVPLGHEISGTIVALGKKVSKFKIGDRVTVDPNWHCGYCEPCLNGLPHLCNNSKGVVKGMAEYICPPQENVYKIPTNMSFSDAALTEPVSCCLHGVEQMELKDDLNVVLIGFGAIGLMMIKLLKAYYHLKNIIVIDNDENKRQKALNAGANYFINSASENVKEFFHKNNIYVQRLIECVGNANCLKLAMEIADKGAIITLFGVPSLDSILDFNLYDFFSKELQLKTSYLNPNMMLKAIETISQGYINTEQNVYKIINLDDLPLELEQMTNIKQGKVLVKI